MYLKVYIVALLISIVCGQRIKNLVTHFQWPTLDFGLPSSPNVGLPVDVGISYAGSFGPPRFFITIPRFRDGVPFSLAEISKFNGPSPVLRPYPNYEYHNSNGLDCSEITSVIRFAIDECNRMWVLDTGMIGFTQRCPSKLIAFDLNTNLEVDRFVIPSNLYQWSRSLLVTPVVDVLDPPPNACRRTRIYIADSSGRGIIVFNALRRQAWRIENALTGPDPRFVNQNIAGESFVFADGVFGMSITPRGLNMTRFLFFHAMASDTEIAVPLKAVNNRRIWAGWNGGWNRLKIIGNRGTQCIQEAISSDGLQFCGYNEPIGIVAWNIRTRYNQANRLLVAYNPETLQFTSGLKVIRNRNGEEEVVVLSNRIQKYFSGSMNYNEINFRIQSCRVVDLMSGFECRSGF